MKKRVLFICVFILVIILCSASIQADVGNSFSGNSGGGFSGGGSGYSGGYSGGYYGGGLGGFMFLGSSPIFSILFIIIVAATIYSISTRSKSGYTQSQPYYGGSVHRVCNEAEAIRKLTAIDPNFSADAFKSYAGEVYITLQEAWEAKDWHKVRPFESNALFNMHNRQIQEYIDMKKTNHLDMQNIRGVILADFKVSGNQEVLSVKLISSLLDYVTDDESGKVIEGSNTLYQHRTYYLEFIRSAGVKTNAEKTMETTNCPNCGAPTQITSSGECEYCHSVITNGDYGWVLNQYSAW